MLFVIFNTLKMIILIPIKKNSKRLKNKNFLLLKKKPLFRWTVDFAKKYFKKHQILISTDCKKTASKLKSEGFQVPFIRPYYLAKQTSSMFGVAKHAINTFEKKLKKKVNKILLFQPTSPFRSITDIKKGIQLYDKNHLPTISVSKLHVKSDKLYHLKKKNIISKIDYKKRTSFIPNGSFYILSKKDLFKKKQFYFNEMNFVEIKSLKNKIDIDYLEDLKIARKI